ncbi:hypothetical protein RHMOL_Rhmol06G0098200 [Rhododendron molle]|uniref:Uncharacterized protein n=1 Tax=Rhododendron molle TaxID=49168 RepID=A0ACC0NC22_RHOML|nr:hypothetical protein RHMOL_Rhmol06G0098200 [Rhododendron molle]
MRIETHPNHSGLRPIFFLQKLLHSPNKHHQTTTNPNSTTETYQPQKTNIQRPQTPDHSSIDAGLFAHHHHPPDLEHLDWYRTGRGKPAG